MPGYYTYLISSLPMLHFGMEPPLSFERFLQLCDGLIADSDIDILKATSVVGECGYEESPATFPPKADQPLAEKKWRAFDITLRNELVKIRAARKRLDPLKYIRGGEYAEPAIAHIALHAYRAPSILEAEKILDQVRWRFLEGLSAGHYFDIDALIIYASKLLILERWDRIDTADRPRMVENVVKQISDEPKDYQRQ